MNLAAILLDSARDNTDRVAVRLADAGSTYGELEDASARVAGVAG
jgi:acyl-CoA synthetase (AMP-forming)/AMP-acid ligase II